MNRNPIVLPPAPAIPIARAIFPIAPTALAPQPKLAPPIPTVRLRVCRIATTVTAQPPLLAQLMTIAALSRASPIAMMVFAQQHNAPATPIAQAPNPIVSAMFAPQLVPPIPNARVTNLIVSADLAPPPARQIPNAPLPHLIVTAVLAALLSPVQLLHNVRALCLIATLAYAIP